MEPCQPVDQITHPQNDSAVFDGVEVPFPELLNNNNNNDDDGVEHQLNRHADNRRRHDDVMNNHNILLRNLLQPMQQQQQEQQPTDSEHSETSDEQRSAERAVARAAAAMAGDGSSSGGSDNGCGEVRGMQHHRAAAADNGGSGGSTDDGGRSRSTLSTRSDISSINDSNNNDNSEASTFTGRSSSEDDCVRQKLERQQLESSSSSSSIYGIEQQQQQQQQQQADDAYSPPSSQSSPSPPASSDDDHQQQQSPRATSPPRRITYLDEMSTLDSTLCQLSNPAVEIKIILERLINELREARLKRREAEREEEGGVVDQPPKPKQQLRRKEEGQLRRSSAREKEEESIDGSCGSGSRGSKRSRTGEASYVDTLQVAATEADDSKLQQHQHPIQVIMKWMDSFQEDEHIQLICLQALPTILEDPPTRLIAQSDGLASIVLYNMAAFPSSSLLQLTAFHTLVVLLRPLGANEGMVHKAHVHTNKSARGIRSINHVTKSNSHYVDTSSVISKTTLNDASYEPRWEENGVRVMLDSLRRYSNDRYLQAMGCWAMVNAALYSSLKASLLRLGGVYACTNAMMLHPNVEAVQFRGLFALINLVIPDNTNKNGDGSSIHTHVYQIARLTILAMKNFHTNKSILNRGCLVLRNLSLTPAFVKILARTPGCVDILLHCRQMCPRDVLVQRSARTIMILIQRDTASVGSGGSGGGGGGFGVASATAAVSSAAAAGVASAAHSTPATEESGKF
eukprot:g4845.t1 g4845   contig18:49061-51524(+)